MVNQRFVAAFLQTKSPLRFVDGQHLLIDHDYLFAIPSDGIAAE
jgi:hypothetical protein